MRLDMILPAGGVRYGAVMGKVRASGEPLGSEHRTPLLRQRSAAFVQLAIEAARRG